MTPVYSKPVNSVQDMLLSESQLIVPTPTAINNFLKLDPSPSVKELNKDHIKMPIKQFYSPETQNRLLIIMWNKVVKPHNGPSAVWVLIASD